MPYLNLDDNFADHPKVEALSDGAFRLLMHEICEWSRTGVATPAVQDLLSQKMVRRAPRHWLPEALLTPARRYRRKIPAEVRALIFGRDGFVCLHCGAIEDLTVDHILPWSLGGSDELDNLQTLCRPCNSRKGARV